MDTGMKDYLTVNHPELLDKLTPNSYDEIFVVPWATSRSALTIHDLSVTDDRLVIMIRVYRNTTKDKRLGVFGNFSLRNQRGLCFHKDLIP